MIYSKNFRLAAIAKRTGGNREAYRIAYRPTEYGEEQGSCTAKLRQIAGRTCRLAVIFQFHWATLPQDLSKLQLLLYVSTGSINPSITIVLLHSPGVTRTNNNNSLHICVEGRQLF